MNATTTAELETFLKAAAAKHSTKGFHSKWKEWMETAAHVNVRTENDILGRPDTNRQCVRVWQNETFWLPPKKCWAVIVAIRNELRAAWDRGELTDVVMDRKPMYSRLSNGDVSGCLCDFKIRK